MFNKTIVAAALLVSSSAFAAPQDLTFDVSADIPTANLSLTPNGGWTSIAMTYDITKSQLNAATKQLDIITDGSKDLEAWLQVPGEMRSGSGDIIDLKVSIKNVELGVGNAAKKIIYPAPAGNTAVTDIIPITVTPATGTHPAGRYDGQLTVIYDLAP